MSVKLTITGDGLNYETDTTLIKSSQIIAFLNADEQSPSNSPSVQATSSGTLIQEKNTKSPREYIFEVNAKTNTQKILAFAKYYCDRNQSETFEPSVIKEYFRRSGEPEPKNYSRDLNDAIRLRYLYEIETGRYSITGHGQDMLATSFESENRSSNVRIRNVSSKKPTPKVVTDAVQNLEILTKLDGIVDYFKVNTKSERILWILFYSQQHSVDELSANDIDYLADKLRDKIPAKSISALTEYSIRKAFVTKNSSNKYKLLHDGMEYVKGLSNNH